jgi:hypothetical protein
MFTKPLFIAYKYSSFISKVKARIEGTKEQSKVTIATSTISPIA